MQCCWFRYLRLTRTRTFLVLNVSVANRFHMYFGRDYCVSAPWNEIDCPKQIGGNKLKKTLRYCLVSLSYILWFNFYSCVFLILSLFLIFTRRCIDDGKNWRPSLVGIELVKLHNASVMRFLIFKLTCSFAEWGGFLWIWPHEILGKTRLTDLPKLV